MKYNFHRWKTVDLPLAADEVRQILSWSKYQSIPFKNIWVIVRKQIFNQNLNLIVDAARPPAIPTNANLLAENFCWKIRLKTENK